MLGERMLKPQIISNLVLIMTASLGLINLFIFYCFPTKILILDWHMLAFRQYKYACLDILYQSNSCSVIYGIEIRFLYAISVVKIFPYYSRF